MACRRLARGLVAAAVVANAGPARAQDHEFEMRGYALNVATGSLEGPLSPAGATDLQRVRLMADPSLGPIDLDLAYEQALRIATDSELTGVLSTSLGRAQTGTEWLPLQGTIAEGEHASWTHRVDRLSATIPLGELVELSAGREAVSWATTLFLTPADPFAPFDPADPFRAYRAGVDVLRARAYPGTFTELDAVVRPAEVGDETTLTAVARGGTRLGPWQLGAWAGAVHDRAAAAASATVTAGGTAFRGEATVRHEAGGTVWRAAVGADRNLSLLGRDLYLAAEYQYDGFGASSGREIVQTVRSDAYRRGELQVLGRHEVALQASWQATPLLAAEGLVLWNASDGSLLVSPAASVSLSNEIEGRAGAYLGFGAETLPPPPGPLGSELPDLPASEYGVVPTSLYVSVSAWF